MSSIKRKYKVEYFFKTGFSNMFISPKCIVSFFYLFIKVEKVWDGNGDLKEDLTSYF